jgi:aspartate/tyrosine/aromatic aminotransferase
MALKRTARLASPSWMNNIPLGPPDALFGLIDALNKDPSPTKVGLGIGAYRDGEMISTFSTAMI